ncbi:MAG: histidinol-phosphate transaminase [Deltaproteobacteria bacterium]
MNDSETQPSWDIPDYLASLVPYPPGKPIEELEREYGIRDIVKLASNENPLGPSPRAVEAVGNALTHLHRYPDGSAHDLKQAIAARYGLKPEGIVLGNGSNELIELLVRVFVRVGDAVVSSEPSFLVYRKVVQAAGGENVIVPLADLHHDLTSIARAVTKRTRIIFLDNPNNPTGTVIPPEQFETFLAGLPGDVVVVLDEAYMEFVDTPSVTVQGVSILGKDPRIVVLRTFSKAYGLAGLRVGYGLMSPDLATFLERVRQPFNVNSLAQAGALAALEDAAHLKATIELTRKAKTYLTESLRGIGCTVYPSNTNFVLVDVKRDAKMVFEMMLRQGVIVRAMGAYGFPTHIRITAGLPRENERCVTALEKVLGILKQ